MLFEHFTNTSCGPCATQNPVFKAFFNNHRAEARHLSMHTSWPGSGDPMYVEVKDESAALVSYYGVSGVPDMFANGVGIGGPTGANEDMLKTDLSPIRIAVNETADGNSREVSVNIATVSDFDDANYVLKVAIIESEIKYNSAPGNNGEKDFGNVFRGWLADKEAITLPAKGESLDRTYTFEKKDTWDGDNIYVLAYVVNTATKEVLNTGSKDDLRVELLAGSTVQEASLIGNMFDLSAFNTGDVEQEVTISIDADHPEDWLASFIYGDEDYTEDKTVTVQAGDNNFNLLVSPGSVAGVGRYTITITSDGVSQSQHFLVFNNVKDIVVSATSDKADLAEDLLRGLGSAENETYASVSLGEFSKAAKNNVVGAVNNVYLSVGWTFPAFTDELVTNLTTLIDNGANLFVSGQDLGWDAASGDSNANGNAFQKQFYTNYMHAKFNSDGAPSTKNFSIVAEDNVFGTVSDSEISHIYGSQYLYPDHISAGDEYAHVFATYPDNGGMGIWAKDEENRKVVYLGIGIEQITDKDVADGITKLTHDWFYGKLTGVEFDAQLNQLLGQNTPNPADKFTTIDVGTLDSYQNSALIVYDLDGKIVSTQSINSNSVQVKTSSLANGIYLYKVRTDNGESSAKKMIVAH